MKKEWQEKTLGEICTVDWGNTSLTKSAYVEGGRFLAVSAAGCDGRIRHKEHEKYTPVLSAIGAQCGRMFFPEEDFTAIKNTITLTPINGTCTGRFLYQLLTHVELPKRGAAQPFISKGDIQAFRVRIPLLDEQRRIAAKLDEAFVGLDKAKESAEKNLQNARALFESHLQSVFTQRGEGWEQKTIGEVCEIRGGGTPSKAVERYWKGMIPWVSPKDMKSDIVSDSIDHISQEAIDGSATSLIPQGAVLMVVRSGILARIVPLAVTGRELTINQDLKALCPKNVIESRFLYSLLESKMPELLTLVSRGATVHRLQTEQIRSLACSVPPKAAQHQIIGRIDLMREETQRLARLYEQKLEALESLKKSILHEAFSGNL